MNHSYTERDENDDYFFAGSSIDLTSTFSHKESVQNNQSNTISAEDIQDPVPQSGLSMMVSQEDNDDIGDEIHLANMAFMNAKTNHSHEPYSNQSNYDDMTDEENLNTKHRLIDS